MRFDGIIFDLDGTLADTGEDLAHAINMTLESYGFEKMGRDEILKHINNGARAFLDGCLPDKIKKEPNYGEFLDGALVRYKGFYGQSRSISHPAWSLPSPRARQSSTLRAC